MLAINLKTKPETVIALELEADQIQWEYRHGMCNKGTMDSSLLEIAREIKEILANC